MALSWHKDKRIGKCATELAAKEDISVLASSNLALSRLKTLFWIRALLFLWLTTGMFTVILEWEHYRRLLCSAGLEPSTCDRVVLALLLWCKSLMLFVPLLLVCGLLAWRNRLRTAATVLLGGWILVTFWLVIDLRLQQIFGGMRGGKSMIWCAYTSSSRSNRSTISPALTSTFRSAAWIGGHATARLKASSAASGRSVSR